MDVLGGVPFRAQGRLHSGEKPPVPYVRLSESMKTAATLVAALALLQLQAADAGHQEHAGAVAAAPASHQEHAGAISSAPASHQEHAGALSAAGASQEVRGGDAPSSAATAQEVHYPDHFRIFTGEGQPVSLQDLVEAMAEAEAVLVGEIHTDPVGHWVQTELLRKALARYRVGDEEGALRHVALSMEMFERDVQGVVDEYLQDLITEGHFKAAARAPRHYDEDYGPMMEVAKAAGIPVIASNAPRRYVNRVSRLGRDALFDLPPRARSYLPPLPYPGPSEEYRQEWVSLMTDMPMQIQCDPPPEELEGEPGEKAEGAEARAATERAGPPGMLPREETPPGMPPQEEATPGMGAMAHMASFMENGPHAQSLWDAAMAYSITTFLDVNPGALVLHMVGGFHVRNFTGIPEAIRHYRPATRTLVISMELAEDFHTFDPQEHGGRGDFVVLTDRSMDLSYVRHCLEGGGGG